MSKNITPISTLTARKAALETKLAQILSASAWREGLSIEYQGDPIDEVGTGSDRDVTIVQLNHNARLGQEIRAAIERVDSGEFGVCEECEEPISQRRLDVVPWARLCVRCQSRAEARQAKAQSVATAA